MINEKNEKDFLTKEEQSYIESENNGWFTDQEIYESFHFKIPFAFIKYESKPHIAIEEHIIFFNLKIMTGLDFNTLPGNVQSIYWFFCERWKSKKNAVKEFLITEFGFILPFKFKDKNVPYAALLFALENSEVREEIENDRNIIKYLQFYGPIREKVRVNTTFSDDEEIESSIDFKKYNLDKNMFFMSIKFYLEINSNYLPMFDSKFDF